MSKEIIKVLCGCSEKGLYTNLKTILAKHYNYTVSDREKYLIAKGNIPILLMAHLDTVFPYPAIDIYHDPEQKVYFSPDGLGADDRAGVYAILSLMSRGLRPHIIFTTGEETGAIGALQLIKDFPKSPFKDLKYIIQLDRRGEKDSVYYNCGNADFEKYINQFGFETAIGTFTDISVICPQWKIAGVNLSVGYENEHSLGEILHIDWLENTINKVEKMLTEDLNELETFKYIPKSRFKFYREGKLLNGTGAQRFNF